MRRCAGFAHCAHGSGACDPIHRFSRLIAVFETLAVMSTSKSREVAKLDRVPLPVEAARVGATGWQITRTGARVLSKLTGKGSLQQKIIKQIPQTFADLGPTYVKFG